MENKIVIFDLDGTLATIDERMKKATGGQSTESDYNKIDWSILHDPENIKMDEPNVPVVETCRLFYDNGYSIYIFSGRSDRTEEATKEWLATHEIPYHKLVMRPNTKKEMFIPDDVLKQSMLDSLGKYEQSLILCVYDDRQKVVDMWRRNGLVCCQVAPGNF